MPAPSHPLMPEVRKLIAQRGPRLAILGPPGAGKSVLFHALVSYLSSKGIRGTECKCLRMDLRNLVLGSETWMYEQLRDMLTAAAEECGIAIGRTASFEAALEHASQLATGYLVVAIDHFDDIPYRFAVELAQHLRSLKEMSEGGIVSAKVGLIVSGCMSVFRLRRETQSGLAQAASFTLPRPEPDAQLKLVRAMIDGRLQLSSDALEVLAHETGGEPAFLNPVLDRLSDSDLERHSGSSIRDLIEAVPFQESRYLRRILLSLLYDEKMAAISVSLAEGKQKLVGTVSPDIDPYQLGGALIAHPSGSYRPRNGIVNRYVIRLHKGLGGVPADPAHPLVAEMLELHSIPDQIRRAEDIWAATPHLLRAWEIATPYQSRPKMHVTASTEGAAAKWLELSSSYSDEGEKPRPVATETVDLRARETGRAVLDSDAQFLAFAVPAHWDDMSASLVVTSPRGEVQWTENVLEHWVRFSARALPELVRHALVHWGKRYVGSRTVAAPEVSNHDIFLSFASANRNEAEEIKKTATAIGVRVFISTTDLETGSRFSDQIREALTQSREVWLLATPEAMNSVWVQTEWGGAWALSKPIVPILLRLSASQLPDRLAALQIIDYHKYSTELKRLATERNQGS